ncbi:hypothetical protein RJ55_03534 [Drechmeria coniospora]|nr:hypothetical protein RJ55_03534 [Drechmeria coniospora]
MPKRTRDSLSAAADDAELDRHATPPSGPGRTPSSRPNAAPARRRITSCAACRKQKIKCELPAEGPPCARCRAKDVECIIDFGLRNSILDQRQLAVLRRDLGHVHANLDRVCRHLRLDPPPPLETPSSAAHLSLLLPRRDGAFDGAFDDGDQAPSEPSPRHSPAAVEAPVDAFLAPQAAPASPLRSDALRWRPTPRRPDMVSKGLLTVDEADVLVSYYLTQLDPVVYGVAGKHRTTRSVRDASPALLAVVCTVSALHLADMYRHYDACYREFRCLVAAATFEKRDLEHVRALVVGAFWLPDASRVLLCDAFRRAGDARLHRHIARACAAADADADARDRVRLWYCLFMCDQHLSVLHNRDGLLRLDREILERRDEFLAADGSTAQDVRTVAQVGLLVTMIRSKQMFGSERPTPVPEPLAGCVEGFVTDTDLWIRKYPLLFQSRDDASLGEFPLFGFRLHHLFARLYLGHHVFRGLRANPIPDVFLAAARMAYASALEIFKLVRDEAGLRRSLVKVPSYIHIMLSFAGHFLLELSLKHRDQLAIAVEDDYRCLGSVVSSLREMRMTPRHPLSRVADGLAKRMFEFAAAYGKELLAEPSGTPSLGVQLAAAWPASLHPASANSHADPTPVFDLESAVMPDEFSYLDYGDFALAESAMFGIL